MDIFSICELQTEPKDALDDLKLFLTAGMPANVRIGQVRDDEDSVKPADPEAGLLHVICENVKPNQIELAQKMIEMILQYGASWVMLDGKNRTPGCICKERKLAPLYEQFTKAGVRSELILRKITEEDESDQEQSALDGGPEETKEEAGAAGVTDRPEPEASQSDYLASKLSYADDTLTTSQNDGVMMSWEDPIMRRSAQIITKPGGYVLNVGFGMGIIDGYIQELKPKKHYIVEAHPDVLAKMRKDGWYDKPNVVVLEGTWKERLPELLSAGTTMSGIYYDTFSEHYRDMLVFFDFVCGLLDFDGVFSFFNGLGADRQICYDVYKEVVDFDLQEYGFQVKYELIPVETSAGTWDGIKRSYFSLSEYALPIVKFAD